MERYVIHLMHAERDGRWHLQNEGTSLVSFDTKEEAENAGRERAEQLWINHTPAQLIVLAEDGSIERQYSYDDSSGSNA